jgi:hypothetical protein
VRVGGSAGCRLSATRAASHGVSWRFEDHSPENQDGYGFPSDPCGVSTPCGCSSSGPPPDPRVGDQPPVRFRAPSETCPCSPAPQRHSAGLLRADGRPFPRCSLSWAFLPYDTVSDRRTRLNRATDPSVAACRVRGLGTPFATSTTDPPGARSAGASMGLTLQGVLLVREWCPFRGPCPPDIADRAPPPRGERTERLPSGPHARDEFVLSPASRRRPAVDTFLGFPSSEPSPHPPGLSLVVTMPALSSFGGMTSLPAWTSGLHGSNGSAWPVSGLPALMRFHTLRPS